MRAKQHRRPQGTGDANRVTASEVTSSRLIFLGIWGRLLGYDTHTKHVGFQRLHLVVLDQIFQIWLKKKNAHARTLEPKDKMNSAALSSFTVTS